MSLINSLYWQCSHLAHRFLPKTSRLKAFNSSTRMTSFTCAITFACVQGKTTQLNCLESQNYKEQCSTSACILHILNQIIHCMELMIHSTQYVSQENMVLLMS